MPKKQKRCKCGVAIHWIGRIPVESDNLFTVVSEDGKILAGYVSHYEQCPHAGEFRSKNPPVQSDDTLLLPGFDSDEPSSEAYQRLKDE